MKNLSVYLRIPLILMFLFLNVGCAAVSLPVNAPDLGGNVYPISYGSVVYGIDQAITALRTGSIASAGVLTNLEQTKFVVYWSVRSVGLGFVGIDASTGNTFDIMAQIFNGGNLGSSRNVTELLRSLEDKGWMKLPNGMVPIILEQAVQNCKDIIKLAAANVGGRLTTPVFFVLPMSIIEELESPAWLECPDCTIDS